MKQFLYDRHVLQTSHTVQLQHINIELSQNVQSCLAKINEMDQEAECRDKTIKALQQEVQKLNTEIASMHKDFEVRLGNTKNDLEYDRRELNSLRKHFSRCEDQWIRDVKELQQQRKELQKRNAKLEALLSKEQTERKAKAGKRPYNKKAIPTATAQV